LTGPHRTANNEYGAIKNADKITRNVRGNALETHKIGGHWKGLGGLFLYLKILILMRLVYGKNKK